MDIIQSLIDGNDDDTNDDDDKDDDDNDDSLPLN